MEKEDILSSFLEYQKKEGAQLGSSMSDKKKIIGLIDLWEVRPSMRDWIKERVAVILDRGIGIFLFGLISSYESSHVKVHQEIKEEKTRFLLSEFIYYYKIASGELRQSIGKTILIFFEMPGWAKTTISFLPELPSPLRRQAEQSILEGDNWKEELIYEYYKKGTPKIRKAAEKEIIDDLKSLYYEEGLDEIVDSEFAGIRDSILPPNLIKWFENKVFNLIKEESDVGLLLRIMKYDDYAKIAQKRIIFLLNIEEDPFNIIRDIICGHDWDFPNYNTQYFVEETIIRMINKINSACPPEWFFKLISEDNVPGFSDRIGQALVRKAKSIKKMIKKQERK